MVVEPEPRLEYSAAHTHDGGRGFGRIRPRHLPRFLPAADGSVERGRVVRADGSRARAQGRGVPAAAEAVGHRRRHRTHRARGAWRSASRSPARDRSASWKFPSPSSQRARRAVGTRNARPGTRVPRSSTRFSRGFFDGPAFPAGRPSIPDAALTSPPVLADRHRQETQEEEAAAPETQGREPPRGEGGGRVSASRPRERSGGHQPPSLKADRRLGSKPERSSATERGRLPRNM